MTDLRTSLSSVGFSGLAIDRSNRPVKTYLTVLAVLAACGDDSTAMVDAGMDLPGIPAACVTERATDNRADDNGYDQIRVLYVLPSDGVKLAGFLLSAMPTGDDFSEMISQ